ncbi:MAG: flagellar assembly peptidoglycan hydrolase FlgJ [Thiohalobacterales bacterium]|nr:flagellar assembly peptidoglycan hydrolase FlgJ [Thiohalobacterales bacterium]
MINEASSASVYTDFQGLAELRVAAGKQAPEAMRETARQFEALFVQTMLKAMRDASPGDGLFDSDQTDFYRDLYDRQLAMEIVKGRGLGIADMLMKDLGGTQAATDQAAQTEPQRQSLSPVMPSLPAGLARPVVDLAGEATPVIALQDTDAGPLIEALPAAEPPPAAVREQVADWHPADPEAFIRDVMPVARRGAAMLGVQPAVLVAQAALETGWGRKMIRRADGSNSFNLFGIKADGRWQGDRATVTTLEYEQGVARRQRAAFRAYGSLAESMADYVDFLRGNPRYQQAIESAGDNMAFLRGLKDAGYATDPDYVEKIRSIMDGKAFDQGMKPLIVAGQESSGPADIW